MVEAVFWIDFQPMLSYGSREDWIWMLMLIERGQRIWTMKRNPRHFRGRPSGSVPSSTALIVDLHLCWCSCVAAFFCDDYWRQRKRHLGFLPRSNRSHPNQCRSCQENSCTTNFGLLIRFDTTNRRHLCLSSSIVNSTEKGLLDCNCLPVTGVPLKVSRFRL